MKKYLSILAIISIFGFASVAFALPFFSSQGTLVPNNSTQDLGTSTAPTGQGSFWRDVFLTKLKFSTTTTGCFQGETTGTFVTGYFTGTDCGSGSSAFPFTSTANYNSTSTVIGFLNGLFSTASSTFNSSLRLPSLSAGGLALDSTGLVYSGATTTFSGGLSYSNGAASLNLANANIWTGLQSFFGSASTTGLSANYASFGETATTTFTQNGYVGIGTTSPYYNLTIASSTSAQLALSAGGGVAQWTFRNAGGNFYLATTTVAGTATSTIAALSINTNGLLTVDSASITTQIITPLVLGGTSTTQDLTLKTTSGVGTTGADMHFLVGNNGATEAMTILNSGFVGINTNAPNNRFQVVTNDSQTVLSSVVAIAGFRNTNTTNNTASVFSFQSTDTSGSVFGGARFGAVFTSHTAGAVEGNFFVDTYGTGGLLERFRITSSGRVGIGLTGPTAVLHLKAGTATANTAPLKFNSGTLLTTAEAGAVEFLTDDWYATITTGAARKPIALMDAAGTAGSVYFGGTNGRITQDNANLFWDNTNNRLGIGTAAPDYALDVSGGSGNAYARVTTTGAANWSTLLLTNGDGSWHITNDDTGKFNIGTGLDPSITHKLTIDTSGNVGIGTSSPVTILDVAGRGRFASSTLSTPATGGAGVEIQYTDGGTLQGRIASYDRNASAWRNLTINANILTLNDSSLGNVGIGTTSPWRTLSVAGTVAMSGLTTQSGSGNVLCVLAGGEVVQDDSPLTACSGASSRTVKHDIRTLNPKESLDLILGLRPVSYVYNSDYSTDKTTHLGFIAEEVKEPRLIDKGEKLGLKYAEFVSPIISAIQEIWRKIASNENRIEKLENENMLLKERIEKLENNNK